MADVLDSFQDGVDGVDVDDVFIDQVESSQAWTTMRDTLINLSSHLLLLIVVITMDSGKDLPGGGRRRKRGGSTTHRVWTFGEECELMCALKDLVRIFTSTENKLVAKFPGTDLKGEPYINSKIHVWKRQYACLRAMLGNSVLGKIYQSKFDLHYFTYLHDVTNYIFFNISIFWNRLIRLHAHSGTRFFPSMLNGVRFSVMIVQMDKILRCVDVVQEVLNVGTKKPCGSIPVEEAGDNTESYVRFNAEKSSFTVDEGSSATNRDKGKGIKQKHVDNHEIQFMDQVGVFYASSKDKFGQIADTIGNIAERVYDLLNVFNFLSVDVRVEVAQYLCNNSNDMDLFISLPDDAKTTMVKRIMRKLDLFNV
ncbi:hypothetical protein ACS0TY_018283 [Phlomoides rotata]